MFKLKSFEFKKKFVNDKKFKYLQLKKFFLLKFLQFD